MPDTLPRIVLDTNVLYAGLYSASGKSHQLLRAIDEGRVRIVLSTPLLFEYEDVLKRNQAVLNLSDAEVEIVLDNLCALADFQAVYFLWRPCLPDAKDDMVLELAVAAQVPRIVSFNAKDFGPASRFGIEVLTPKIMLEELQ
ncbi:MAG: putative toxin-antitoxin system toxin component, PIN family [Candidatus Dechloromonas phosphoritropha]|jgi:putative PIN family toxin of toxin-antitoxin system|nr:putative toxin-antitoxin system toxin component, PIN family [Azonexus sp.]MBP9226939.1 putative toxin-antitoxin system toxin component, PIN family [Azonexus sp.]